MRTIATFAVLLAAAMPAAAQQHQHQHQAGGHQHAAGQGEHAAPAGWEFRLDRANADRGAVHFMQHGEELHFRLGPSGIFFNPANTRTGAYQVSAEFQQQRAPEHPEAYGLVFGGQNLTAENQDYMYFLVRGGGQFTVKHRAGSEVHTIADWADHAAINRQDAEGKATNRLSVAVTPETITYFVNGTQVYRIDRAAVGHPINTDGVAGLRVNHNLYVHVAGFEVTGG